MKTWKWILKKWKKDTKEKQKSGATNGWFPFIAAEKYKRGNINQGRLKWKKKIIRRIATETFDIYSNDELKP